MKTLLIILLLASTRLMAQVDSSAIKINVNIQARDAEYITSFIYGHDRYETSYDAIKSKFRVQSPPSNTTLLAVDSVCLGEWLSITDYLRKDYIAIQGGVFSRIDAILRAKNQAYLTRLLNDANAFDMSQYINRRALGRQKAKKSLN